ncbi:hypothetical protein [Lacticaseibacillus kribbianus]|uniref:hypothetical protein n=1 Tax=Lacticaseibacillus kribbianus TaxID=2926292 RepID=UPI001CD2D418|nr:hypothetical protein [Lacticaseibacillus kribbianus]
MKISSLNSILLAVEVIGVLLGYLLIYVPGFHVVAWVALVVWLLGCQQAFNWYLRRRKRALAVMWQKAGELGFAADALAGLAPQYDATQWAMSAPDYLQFLPAPAIVDAMTHRLDAQLVKREQNRW